MTIGVDWSVQKSLWEEAARLELRRTLAEDLGAAVLNFGDPYESDDILISFYSRLHGEQPDLYDKLREFNGRLFSIYVDRVISKAPD